jgi:hypothetical protein
VEKYSTFIEQIFAREFVCVDMGTKQFLLLNCKVKGKNLDGSECTGVVTLDGPFYAASAGWSAQKWDGCAEGDCPNDLVTASPVIVEVLSSELDTQPRN